MKSDRYSGSIADLYHGAHFAFVLGNAETKWVKVNIQLPKDIQDEKMSVSGLKGSRFCGRNFFDTAKEGVMEKVKTAGKSIEVYSLSEDERQRWLEKGGKPIWDKWVKTMEAKGFSNAQNILDDVVGPSQ